MASLPCYHDAYTESCICCMRKRVRSLTFLAQQLEKAGLVSLRPPHDYNYGTPQRQLEAMAHLLVRKGDEVVALSDKGFVVSSCEGEHPAPPGDVNDDEDRLPLESIGDFFDFALYSYVGGAQVGFKVYVEAVQRGLKAMNESKKSERQQAMNALTLLVVVSSLDAISARFKAMSSSSASPRTSKPAHSSLDLIKLLADGSEAWKAILQHLNESAALLAAARQAVGAFQRRESPAQCRAKVYKSAVKLIPALYKLREQLKEFKDPEREANLLGEIAVHAAAAVAQVGGTSHSGDEMQHGRLLASALLSELDDCVSHMSAVSLLYNSVGNYTAKPVMDGICNTPPKLLHAPRNVASSSSINVLPLLGLFGKDLYDQLEFILRKTPDPDLSCLLDNNMPEPAAAHYEAHFAVQQRNAKWIGVSRPRCFTCAEIVDMLPATQAGTGSLRIEAMEAPMELDLGGLTALCRELAAHIYRSLDEEKIEKEYERLRQVEVAVKMELIGLEE